MTGIGIDIVEIKRIETAVLKRGKRFLERIFSPGEINYCSEKINPYPSYAARFAAKEAYIKFTGGLEGISLIEIEVVNEPSGKPRLLIQGNPAKGIHLSLSHSRDNAVAVVVGD